MIKVAIVGASGETGQSIINGLLGASDTKFVCDSSFAQIHSSSVVEITYIQQEVKAFLGQSL